MNWDFISIGLTLIAVACKLKKSFLWSLKTKYLIKLQPHWAKAVSKAEKRETLLFENLHCGGNTSNRWSEECLLRRSKESPWRWEAMHSLIAISSHRQREKDIWPLGNHWFRRLQLFIAKVTILQMICLEIKYTHAASLKFCLFSTH